VNDLKALCDRLGITVNGTLSDLEDSLCQLVALFTGSEKRSELTGEQMCALFSYDWRGMGRETCNRLVNRLRKKSVEKQREEVVVLAEQLLQEGTLLLNVKLRWDGEVYEPDRGLDEKKMLRSIGYLFDEFAVDKWHFLIWMQFAKLTMISFLGLIPGLPWVKLSWGFGISLVCILVLVVLKPIQDPGVHTSVITCFFLISCQLYFGLLLTRDDHESRDYLRVAGWTILIMDLCFLIHLPFVLLYWRLQAKREVMAEMINTGSFKSKTSASIDSSFDDVVAAGDGSETKGGLVAESEDWSLKVGEREDLSLKAADAVGVDAFRERALYSGKGSVGAVTAVQADATHDQKGASNNLNVSEFRWFGEC